MRFVIDAQLPPALARLLASRSHHAEHVADIGLRDADDSTIWRHAVEHQAILVTKDEDFPHRLRQGGTALWLRIGNTSRRALLGKVRATVAAGRNNDRSGRAPHRSALIRARILV